MNERRSSIFRSEIDRLRLSAEELHLVRRIAELYVPEPPPAARGRRAREGRSARAARLRWRMLTPAAAAAAALISLWAGLRGPGEALPQRRAEAAAATAARARVSAAAGAAWEERLLFSDVASPRGGQATLPPEYRAIESVFFEG